jgi:hypothetical protein
MVALRRAGLRGVRGGIGPRPRAESQTPHPSRVSVRSQDTERADQIRDVYTIIKNSNVKRVLIEGF